MNYYYYYYHYYYYYYYYRCLFLFVCFLGGDYSNLLLVHLRLKHRGNVFFGEDARKDNSPRVISCYQAKTKVSVFSRKP